MLLGLAIIFIALFAVYAKGLYQQRSWISHDHDIQVNVDQKNDFEGLSIKLTELNHEVNEQHGYVFVLSYSGQQGDGIQALTSLQCWVASFNLPMLILEPIMTKSAFVSFPTQDLKNSQFLRFSDMIDIEHFNRITKSSGYALMGTREDFFTAAPRNAIIVQVKLAQDDQILPPRLSGVGVPNLTEN